VTAERLAPPSDIGRWREGGSGIDWLVRLEGERPGPTAMILGLIHGNEICGAAALDRLLAAGVKPARGRLFCCFANVAAYLEADSRMPETARFLDEDMNRLWSPRRLGGSASSRELARARTLRPFVEAADYLLDLHSMQDGETPLALCGMTEKGRHFARRVGYPATVVADPGHRGGVRLIDYGDFAREGSTKAALLVECGRHFAPLSGAVALEAALRFLLALEMVDPAFAAALLGRALAAPPPQRVIEVTETVVMGSRDFAFARPWRNMDCVTEAGTLVAREGQREIRTPYADCVLVMPARRIQPGLTAVRLGRVVRV
jgi:succinylglutamate desuccinylase